ncbi:LysE family translocator [Rhodoligotrophos defluvii]|uniref:LysE family translocator n=1 Tax=Rhodoligotrophos defluvii TaxID=2561934 RepID=UPI0010C935F5|nr:LysE family translocator [Rhodoligotrophos defluvii]
MTGFLAFLGLAAVVIVTPGPDTAVTIRNTLLGSRPGGVMTALGVASGQVIWALATSAGIVAILVASKPLFLALTYAGAAYLVFLGIQALRDAFGSSGVKAHIAQPINPSSRLRPLAAFRQGLVSDLGNPKMAIFFASLLPQFVPAGEASFFSFLLLGLIFSGMTFGWLTLYAVLVATAGDFLRRSAVRRWIEGLMGGLLVAFGIRIALEGR